VRAAELPTSTPSAQGVDARGVLALLDAWEAAPGVEPHSVVVLRHGHVVAAGWWAPYTAKRPHLLYSLSKSFTGAAVGLAVAEGLVGLDDRVVDHFPELAGEVSDPRSRAERVRHLLAMASGHTSETWHRAVALDAAEPVRGFLLLPPEREPGSVFTYNNPCSYTLGAIVQRASGQTLTEFLRPRLLDPLGIGEVGWGERPPGRQLALSGLHATTDAIARFGQLHLQGGRWRGRQLLPAAWVAEATRAQVSTKGWGDPDWEQGYGYQLLRSRHGYRGDGAYGQFCLVLPDSDAVVAITSQSQDTPAMLDAVWEHLLPALHDGPLAAGSDGADDGAAADDVLAERLAHLALAVLAGAAQPPADTSSWAASFAPAGGECAAQPSLLAVELSPTAAPAGAGSGGDGWQVVLVERRGRLVLPLGRDEWTVTEAPTRSGASVPAAASGGWTDAHTLHIDIVFLETPHRLRLTCHSPQRTFEAFWVTSPLDATHLHDLHSPR
jgi:CubicO group peptidase (beta-lactamase class C family)